MIARIRHARIRGTSGHGCLTEERPAERGLDSRVRVAVNQLSLARTLAAAERYGRIGIERFYRNGLFRGATNQWIYDSQLDPGTLVHGLVRLHAVIRPEVKAAPPLYYHR